MQDVPADDKPGMRGTQKGTSRTELLAGAVAAHRDCGLALPLSLVNADPLLLGDAAIKRHRAIRGMYSGQKIVERHSGTIWVESTFKEGSTFYFTLQLDSESCNK